MEEMEEVVVATIWWLEAYKTTNEEVMDPEDIGALDNTINYWKEKIGE